MDDIVSLKSILRVITNLHDFFIWKSFIRMFKMKIKKDQKNKKHDHPFFVWKTLFANFQLNVIANSVWFSFHFDSLCMETDITKNKHLRVQSIYRLNLNLWVKNKSSYYDQACKKQACTSPKTMVCLKQLQLKWYLRKYENFITITQTKKNTF